MSSMLLAHITEYPDDFPKAVEIAVNIVRGTLLNTVENPLMGENEIQLIGSRDIIINPNIDLKVNIL